MNSAHGWRWMYQVEQSHDGTWYAFVWIDGKKGAGSGTHPKTEWKAIKAAKADYKLNQPHLFK